MKPADVAELTLAQATIYYASLSDSGDQVKMSDADQKAYSARRRGEKQRWLEHCERIYG